MHLKYWDLKHKDRSMKSKAILHFPVVLLNISTATASVVYQICHVHMTWLPSIYYI